MKKILLLLLSLVMILSVFAGCGKPSDGNEQNENNDNPVNTDKEENKLVITDTFYPQYSNAKNEYKDMRAEVKKWFDENLENGTLFSVKVGDENIANIAKRWEKDIKKTTDEKGHEQVVAVFTDAKTSMKYTLEATLYCDYPTVDYVVWAENTSKTENSPLISDFYAVDSAFKLAPKNGYTLHTTIGSPVKANDFELVEQKITKDRNGFTYMPDVWDGRSTTDAWPYFDIIGNKCGLMVAVGWTGVWEANFALIKNGEINIKAKQHFLNTVLFPEEKVRSPRVVLTYFDGDAEYGHNVFRKLIIEHYTPNDGTENRFVSPITISFWGGIRESYAINQINKYIDAGVNFDNVWFDAHWNGHGGSFKNDAEHRLLNTGTDWWLTRGDWVVNKVCYPSGSFKKISDILHANNKTLMIWWQIEDARNDLPKDKLTFGRESYYDYVQYDKDLVLNLSDDAVLDKLLNYYYNFFEENGVDHHRIDTGVIGYVKFWNDNDTKVVTANNLEKGSRGGITENKHTLNFYKLWDSLKEKFPNFMLDNTAGGGKRMDIEMLKHGITLWKSDYDCNDHVDLYEARQAQTQWLSYWIPLFAGGSASVGRFDYYHRSTYSASCQINDNIENLEKLKSITQEFIDLKPYWYGSYYQILEPNTLNSTWQAYELFRDDWQKGALMVCRRPESNVSSMNIKLKGLLPEQNYLIHNYDETDTTNDIVMSGKDLMEKGLDLELQVYDFNVYMISIVLD